MTLHRSFGAVVDVRTRVLILGSLPGVRSLAAAEYYAHPSNAFWTLLGTVLDRDLRALTYDARLTAVLDAGVGLWDVVAAARRQGSLDSGIRAPELHDLAGLLRELPALNAVAFNGQTAAALARRQRIKFGSIAQIELPSSSAAYTLPVAVKVAAWSVERAAELSPVKSSIQSLILPGFAEHQ